MGKMVFEFTKVKSRSGLRALLAHNLRVDKPANADPEKANQNMIGKYKTIDSVMTAYKDNLNGAKIRKNAVWAHEYIISGSHADLTNMSRAECKAYFQDAVDWLRGHYGKESLIMPVIHFDEHSPHAHIIVQPIKNGKLTSKPFVGGHKDVLGEMRTRFHRDVASKYGLERGQPRPYVKKTSLDDHRRLIEKELPEAEQSLKSLDSELTRLTECVGDKLLHIKELENKVSALEATRQHCASLTRDELQNRLDEIDRQNRPAMR